MSESWYVSPLLSEWISNDEVTLSAHLFPLNIYPRTPLHARFIPATSTCALSDEGSNISSS